MNGSVSAILTEAGIAASMQVQQINGGDINEAYKLYNHNRQYFLKVNDAYAYPGMLHKEALGLQTLRENSLFIIPEVLKNGVTGNKQFLLMEWVERSNPCENYWEIMGEQLAFLHQQTSANAGFFHNNYIGNLEQLNHETTEWSTFYAEFRLQPLIKKLLQMKVFSAKEQQFANRLYQRLPQLFPNEPHALLHGDLWGGNHFPNEKGLPVLIDPAVYYGHREMDIGMTALFGGFHPAFYTAYNYHYPLESGWQQRLQLTQLYPLLVHAVLFGGHYVYQSAEILRNSGS
ncbi:MAG: fructosamine kinase family protein [Lacibacter sp.]